MKNSVATRQRFCERGQIQIVAFNELEIFMRERAFQKFPLAGGKIIPADDGFTIGEQPVGERAADETGDPSDENLLHDRREI
jgi:hypothetical protein